MQSIIDQKDADEPFEVIVVDNGSIDETKVICAEFDGYIDNFIYYYDDIPGLLTGRHKGAELSNGKILSFIDDDVELNPNWVHSILVCFNKNKHISILSGPCLPKYLVYPPNWVQHFWQPTPYGGKMCLPLSLIDIGAEQVEIDPLYAFGLNYSIRKDVLYELGGFHPDCIPQHLQKYQGDGETGLSIKARVKQIKALYVSSALLYHQVSPERLTAAYFEKWHYYSGVCNSFTDIRIKHNLYQGYAITNTLSADMMLRLRSKAVHLVKSLLTPNSKIPEEISRLQSCFNRRFKEGYDFHQHSFSTDKKVKNWVLRSDYWDYRLPLDN